MLKNKRQIQNIYHIIKNEIENLSGSENFEDKQIAYELIR